jgi:hypothetical protein
VIVGAFDDSSATLFVKTILSKQQLDTLQIEGLWVEPNWLAQYVTDTHHRTYVEYTCNGRLSSQVQYHSALNQFGRRTCRNVESAKEQMVHHLVDLDDCQDMECDYKTVVLYGLLHEAPGLWAA